MTEPRPKPLKPNLKATSEDIIRYNSLGYSLLGIARETGCHSSTISLRLTALKLKAFDTRRSLMEDICKSFTPEQLDWLANQLGPDRSVKDYLRELIVKEFDLMPSTQTQKADQ